MPLNSFICSYISFKFSQYRRQSLERRKRNHTIVGDMDSVLIKGTNNIIYLFINWFLNQAPLNLQWPVLENDFTNLDCFWFADSM